MENMTKKGVSTVLITVCMIAVAVATLLVAYAWVMNYIRFKFNGEAVQIQDIVKQGNNLLVYIQNVGSGSLTISDIYVNGLAQSSPDLPKTLLENQTTVCTIQNFFTEDTPAKLDITVITTDGTFSRFSGEV